MRGFSLVESESLFIEVTEKMKRFDRNIRAFERSLQQTPKVFDSVRVNVSAHIFDRMIDHVVDILFIKARSEVLMRLGFNP